MMIKFLKITKGVNSDDRIGHGIVEIDGFASGLASGEICFGQKRKLTGEPKIISLLFPRKTYSRFHMIAGRTEPRLPYL